MASHYSPEDLCTAVQLIKEEKLSYRKAAAQYGIPRSTLHDHVNGKVCSSKRGPPTVLTVSEEQMLVDWVLYMAEIGYGRTKEELCGTVKKILDRDKRENPFTDNYPGRDWWYAFLRRHPQLSVRTPESLQICRASSCTPERLDKWFSDFAEFVQKHGFQDKPQRIWNADESGFPLCPKTSRVLAMRNKRHVYSVNADSKTQITTLVAANAAGSVIPPMHVFPGKRFHYNPLEGGVAGAYLGKSDNGWMVTHLFYGWVANHFVKHIPADRPVLLLVDGHTTHIDVEISKFCKANGILLYCLLPHSSHITQPLDVGFFGALKTNWGKAVDKYKIANMGSSVTKEKFAEVFNTAWTSTVKMATIVNSFARAGIYPVDRSAVKKSGPAKLYSESSTDSSSASSTSYESSSSKAKSTASSSSSLEVIEAMMNPSTLAKYNERFAERYDVRGDELYDVWSNLKRMTVSSTSNSDQPKSPLTSDSDCHLPPLTSKNDYSPPVEPPANSFKEILVYPDLIPKKSRKKDPMPPHLNSSQMIEYLESKKKEKQDLEIEKERKRVERETKKVEREAKKAEREAKKVEREAEREAKKAEKEAKKAQKEMQKKTARDAKTTQAQAWMKRNRRPQVRPVVDEDSFAESESTSTDENSHLEICPECHKKDGDDSAEWVACDSCSQWYHVHCTSIPFCDYGKISSLNWFCDECISMDI